MKFVKQSDIAVWVSGDVKVNRYTVIIRIDGRGSSYRVDAAKPLMPMWEAIDGGDGFDTLKAAQEFAKHWLAAAIEQNDLTPKIER